MDEDKVAEAPTGGQDPEYRGLLGRTRQEAIHYTCSECGALFGAAVHTSINVATDEDLGEALSKGELNRLTCSACGSVCVPDIPLLYHDPKARCFAVLLPESLRHEELGTRARVLQSLMDDSADVPDYVRRVDVVFGTAGLLSLLDETMEALTPASAARDELERIRLSLEEKADALEQREGELLAREEDLQAKQEDLLVGKDKLDRAAEDLARGWADIEREREALRALALDLQSRQRAQPVAAEEPSAAPPDDGEEAESAGEPPDLAGRPKEDVDRWRASDDSTTVMHHDGRVLLLARPGELLGGFRAAEPEILVQLHRTPTGPLVTLVAQVAGEQGDAGADLWWALDPAREDHGAVLEKLADECVVTLDLYDDESRPVATWEIRAPLAENVNLLLEQGRAMVEETPPEDRDFHRAVQHYDELGDERLGRKQHNFAADSFRELATPAAARLALGIVSYWSEPENEDYLICIKSFPLGLWRAIRERVARKAIEYGLHLGPELADFVLKQKLAKGPKELLRTCVANFAEVSLRIKPSDLDPAQELENWRLLLAECVKEDVQVDVEIEELAAAAAKRAGVSEDETAAGGDLGTLSEDELLPLLANRGLRRDAALELCERGSPKMVEPIYRAVCNMSRSEVARVVPAMIPLGRDVVRFFIKGLKHRKSFLRQGCALALGAMKCKESIAPLMEMLLAEPTNVWKEASRALGEMGTLSLGALIAGVKNADAEGRERIAWALSQSSLDSECRVEVEAMAKGADTRLARVAARATELMTQVRANDEEVRGGRPLRDQTIVRSFTRQFYDAMAGEVSELSEEDILEQEEVLDDSDILDEEVQVSEEDII